MQHWLAMGGYGAYVWSAYACVLIGMVLPWWLSRRRFRRLLNSVRERHAR